MLTVGVRPARTLEGESVDEQLVETWNIHDRINRYLLDAVPAEALGSAFAQKHRTVFQLFAHIHNVRLMWLKSAAPELLEGLSKVEGENGDKKTLTAALEGSGRAIEALVRKSVAAGGLRKNPDVYLKEPRPPVLKDYFNPRLRQILRLAPINRQVKVRFKVETYDVYRQK